MKKKIYDMIIVGGGPGGYTAALYGARAGLTVLVLEKLSAGGQMAQTLKIENYPGFEEGIDGFELGQRMQKGAQRFGVETVYAEVYRLELKGKLKTAETSEGVFEGKTVVIATGAVPGTLGIPGEAELTGGGVHYCAACDGMFYRGKTVVVVGGGNSAAADALLLSKVAKKVIIVHRRDALRAEKVSAEALLRAENVQFCWDSEVQELIYGERLEGIRIKNKKTAEETTVEADGVFVSIGRKPASGLVEKQLALDPAGYIVADESTKTDLSGVFAIGDVRTKALRQIVTAVADGAVAAHYAEEDIAGFMLSDTI